MQEICMPTTAGLHEHILTAEALPPPPPPPPPGAPLACVDADPAWLTCGVQRPRNVGGRRPKTAIRGALSAALRRVSNPLTKLHCREGSWEPPSSAAAPPSPLCTTCLEEGRGTGGASVRRRNLCQKQIPGGRRQGGILQVAAFPCPTPYLAHPVLHQKNKIAASCKAWLRK